MLYQIKGDHETQSLFSAVRFYYETNLGRYLLLQWIARHTDQASQAEIWLAPFEQPETWLSDVQVKTESQTRAPMGRVLDVSRLGGCRLDRGAFLRGSPIRSARGMRASGGSSRRMERCKSRGRTRQIAF
jgi:hypothetical protein